MLAAMLLPGLTAAIALAAPVGPLTSVPPPPTEIFGGEATAPGAWPAVVAINIGSSLCTGTLVSPTVILTAAHCLADNPDLNSMSVQRGDDINQFPGPQRFKVAAYGSDPQFCGEKTCKADIHDYGFIVLTTPQNDILEFPRPVADQDEWDDVMDVDSTVTLVGYGLNEGDITGIKRQVEVPITKFSDSGLEFQAGGNDRDSCQGDSGGPAFAKLKSGEWILAGITSRGYTCGKGGFYSVPQGGLCWYAEASGLDLRPPDCENCDCINTDPNRGGCGCTTTHTDPAALLLLPLLLALRRRR